MLLASVYATLTDPTTASAAVGGLVGGSIGGALASWRAIRGKWRRDVEERIALALARHVQGCPFQKGPEK